MKYFTKEWYDEMQVLSFLTFPETAEEWEEERAYYKEEGIDIDEVNQRNLEESRADLLKYLPEPFHPYIQDGTINEGFPPQKLRDMAKRWEEDHEMRMEALFDHYSRYYESIKEKLPAGAIQLVEQSLHDAVVLSVEKPTDDVLLITLDCSGGFHYFTDIRVTFTGVTEADIPQDFKDACWLYNEIYLAEAGFELHVLFDSPMVEATISAHDVKIEVLE